MGGANLINQAGSQPEPNVMQKIFGVFFSPTMTFQSIDRKPGWIVPVVVILLVTIMISIIANPIILPLRKDKILEKMEINEASKEQIAMASEQIDKSARLDFVFVTIRSIVKLLVLTFVVQLVGKVILYKDTTFQTVFSIVAYSYLPWIFGVILVAALMVFQKSPDIHFSLAMFLPDEMWSAFGYRFLKTIGVFSIWHFVVLAMGCSVIYKIPLKTKIGSIIVLLIIYIPCWAILTMFLI